MSMPFVPIVSTVSASSPRSKIPMVSVIVPCRNEERFIQRCLESILLQTYSLDRMEIIVVDGRSSDNSRHLIKDFVKRNACVHFADNPGLYAASGLNCALSVAAGDVIIRVDAHATVATDFVEQNVALLHAHPEAWSVGGPIVHRGRGATGRAIAMAMSHPFGVGNARHRFLDYEGYVEGTAFPACWRSVFETVGLYDECLIRNQDDDLSFRIRRQGGCIFMSTTVRSTYYVRDRFGRLFRQYLQYGFWKVALMRKHSRVISWRSMAPLLLVGSSCVSLAFLLFGPVYSTFVSAVPVVFYAIANGVFTVRALRKAPFGTAVRLPVAFVVMHLGYGLGLAYGLFRWMAGCGNRVPSRLSKLSR